MNEENIEKYDLNNIKIIEQNSSNDFYPLTPEDYPKYSYSYTNSLYNSRINYNDNPLIHRKYIGQFILGEKLGQGTFGIVVLGKHQLTGEKVAVKILEKEKIIQEADKTRIEREIKILKNLRHNNIVHLYDVKETASSLYIIMEYVQGKELFDYIVSKKRLSEIEACNFYQQIISGVEYLGKIRVVHRDLKPENLLLDNKKNLKIVDFGLSNIYPNNELLKTACGSPCYAAPEMINGELYKGLGADIWSSGIVLYAMLCGYLPFEDADNEILYKKITDGKFKTPKYLSENCKDILHRILNVDPEKRYTIKQIKKHPWFNLINPRINMSEGLLLNVNIVPIDEKIIDEMENKFKFKKDEIRANLISNNHNHTTTTYYLLLSKKIREGKKSIGDMRSKEFINYITNPVNLLSTYGYDIKLIIQIRNSSKNKENIEKNFFDTYKNNSAINMNKKNKYDKQISERKIYYDKEKQIIKMENKNKNDNIIEEINGVDYRNKAEKFKKYNTKNESTKETLNCNNNESNSINYKNLSNKPKTILINKKIKEYKNYLTIDNNNNSKYKKEFNEKNKEQEKNKNNRDKSYDSNRIKKIKPKRTKTNNYEKPKKNFEKFNTTIERNINKIKDIRKDIKKTTEFKAIKDKPKLATEENIIDKDKEYITIKSLTKQINKKESNNKKKIDDSFDEGIQNNQIYYLLTEKADGKYTNENNNEINMEKRNEIMKNNILDISINNSNKLAQKILNINAFRKNQNIIKHLIINGNIKRNERDEKNPKYFKEVNKKHYINKKRFIETSVSFDKSRGLTQDKINKKINKGKHELSRISKKITKEKEMKYLKLKAKNKKFGVIKIDEENIIKDEENYMSINIGNRRKNITQRNRREKINNTIKNYTTENTQSQENKKDLYFPEDISSIRIDTIKYEKGEDSIKKISLNKKRLLTLINEPKKIILPDKIDNSNINNKVIKSNNNDKNKQKNNNFSKTSTINNDNKFFPFKSKIKKRFFKSNCKFENFKSQIKNTNEFIEPFDLNSIFFQNIDIIKEKILNEAEHKKWKDRKKKKGYFLFKNNEEIDFNINTYNNDNNSNSNIIIIKAVKKKGNIQFCRNFVKNILFKLK